MGFKFHVMRVKVSLFIHRDRTVAAFKKLSELQVAGLYSDELSEN